MSRCSLYDIKILGIISTDLELREGRGRGSSNCRISVYDLHFFTNSTPYQTFDNISSTVFSGNTSAVYSSDPYGPDAIKLTRPNETVNAWWYFDVVSENLKGLIDIFFYLTPAFTNFTSAVSVSLSTHFPNGTAFNVEMSADSDVVITEDNGSSGNFLGTGFEWTGAPDTSSYVVKIDSPTLGVNGNIHFAAMSLPTTFF